MSADAECWNIAVVKSPRALARSRIAAYRASLGPTSSLDSLCANIVGNREEPSGEIRMRQDSTGDEIRPAVAGERRFQPFYEAWADWIGERLGVMTPTSAMTAMAHRVIAPPPPPATSSP